MAERNERIPIMQRSTSPLRPAVVPGMHRADHRGWSEMRRLYTRAAGGKGYVPVGYICAFGHVEVDPPADPEPAG